MTILSLILIPTMIMTILFYGLYKKCDLYNSFIEGAKEGINAAISIFPYTVSMVFAVNVFLHSGLLTNIFSNLKDVLPNGISPSIFPMALLRPISGSAAEVIMVDIFKEFGPDSFIGRIASTLQGSTDTTMYVITLYFGSVGVKKVRYALKAGLFADLIGISMSFLIVYLVFGL